MQDVPKESFLPFPLLVCSRSSAPFFSSTLSLVTGHFAPWQQKTFLDIMQDAETVQAIAETVTAASENESVVLSDDAKCRCFSFLHELFVLQQGHVYCQERSH